MSRLVGPEDEGFWDPEVFLAQTKIRPKTGGLIPFHLKPDQRILSLAVLRCYTERKWLAYVKPRQVGSSTFFTGVVYQHVAYRTGCKGAIVAHTQGQAKKLAAMAMRFWKTTDERIRVPRDTQKKTHLSFPDRDSELEVASVQDDEPLRGDTAQIVMATEIGSKQWEMKQDAWSSILNAVPGPEDNGLVFAESTPFHYGDQLHQTVMESEAPDSRWLTVFVPWTQVQEYTSRNVPNSWKPRRDVLDYANEYGLTREQAHYLQTVLLPKCRGKWGKVRREYPVTIVDAFSLSGEPIFDESILLRWLQRIDGGTGVMTEVEEYLEFQQPEKGHRYVIAVDPASGFTKRDHFGVVVLDLTTCEVVAEFLGHRSAGRMARQLAKLGKRFNYARIYVEANGVGEGVLSHLLEVEGYSNVFCRSSSDTVRDGGELIPGFWSGSSQKAAAMGFLQDLVDDDSLTIFSVRLLRQLINYRGGWEKRRRDESDGHFDLVAALAIAAWAYFHEVRSGQIRKRRSDSEVAKANWDAVMRKLNAMGQTKTNTPFGDHR